jgi:hypothetical protein
MRIPEKRHLSFTPRWSVRLAFAFLLNVYFMVGLVQAASYADNEPVKNDAKIYWPMMQGETLEELADKLYPDSPILKKRFINKTLSMSRDIAPTLQVNKPFQSAQMLIIPNEKAVRELTHKIRRLQDIAPQEEDKLKFSYNLSKAPKQAPILPKASQATLKPNVPNLPQSKPSMPTQKISQAPAANTANAQVAIAEQPSENPPDLTEASVTPPSLTNSVTTESDAVVVKSTATSDTVVAERPAQTMATQEVASATGSTEKTQNPTIATHVAKSPQNAVPATVQSSSGFSLPSVTLPNLKMPNINWASIVLPQLRMPQLSLPNIAMPNIHLPNINWAQVTLPTIDFQHIQQSLANGWGSTTHQFNGFSKRMGVWMLGVQQSTNVFFKDLQSKPLASVVNDYRVHNGLLLGMLGLLLAGLWVFFKRHAKKKVNTLGEITNTLQKNKFDAEFIIEIPAIESGDDVSASPAVFEQKGYH